MLAKFLAFPTLKTLFFILNNRHFSSLPFLTSWVRIFIINSCGIRWMKYNTYLFCLSLIYPWLFKALFCSHPPPQSFVPFYQLFFGYQSFSWYWLLHLLSYFHSTIIHSWYKYCHRNYWLIDTFIHWSILSSIHSFIHSFNNSFITYSLFHSCINLFLYSLILSVINLPTIFRVSFIFSRPLLHFVLVYISLALLDLMNGKRHKTQSSISRFLMLTYLAPTIWLVSKLVYNFLLLIEIPVEQPRSRPKWSQRQNQEPLLYTRITLEFNMNGAILWTKWWEIYMKSEGMNWWTCIGINHRIYNIFLLFIYLFWI